MFKDENRHYSLRKLSVGLASVLIGISFASNMNSSNVKADTVNGDSNSAQTVVKDSNAATKADAKDDTHAAESNTESALKASKKDPNVIAQDIKQKAIKASEAVTKLQNTAEKTAKGNTPEAAAKNTTDGSQAVAESTLKGTNLIAKQQNTTVKGSANTDKDDSSNVAENDSLTAKNNALKAKVEAAKQGLDTPAVSHTDGNETTLNIKGSKAITDNMLKEGKTEVKNSQDRVDPVKSKLKLATLLTTTGKKLNAQMLSASKVVSPTKDTNGGFDSSWGKLNVNDWQGSVQGDYYQLTDYTGDANHVIVPNEADFEKAGISTSGKQVGVTRDLMHTIFRDKTTAVNATVAFSKTDNKMVKAINANWYNTWGHGSEYVNGSWISSKGKLTKFDGSNLDVANVINMNEMFSDNQISDLSPLSNWKVDNVTNMGLMFYGNQISDLSPLSNWKVDNVTDMYYMFYGNQISDLSPLSNWKVDNVTDMGNMFESNQISDLRPLSNWNVYNVTNIHRMFNYNTSTQIKNIQAKRVINFVYPAGYTGKKHDNITQTIDVPQKVHVRLVTKAAKPSNNILDWVTKTETPEAPDPVYFQDYTVPEIKGLLEPDKTVISRQQADIAQPINVTVTYKLVKSNTNDAFALDPKNGLHEHANVNDNGSYDEDYWGKINVDDWNYTVNGDTIEINGLKDSASVGANDAVIVPNLDDFKLAGKDGGAKAVYISKNTLSETAKHNYYGLSKTNGNTFSTDSDLNSAFANNSNLTYADLNSLNTSNVTDMNNMFYGTLFYLTTLDVSNWDTSNVTNMSNMFYYANSLKNLDVSKWDTRNVTDMNGMFVNTSSLTSLDVSKWDTSKVTDMSYMFYNASGLTNLDVSNWDTGKVTDMSRMFDRNPKLALIVNGDKFADYLVNHDSFAKSNVNSNVKSVTTNNAKLLQLLTNDARHDSATRTIVFTFPANYSPDLVKYHLTKVGNTYQIKQSADYDKPYLQGTVLINGTDNITEHHIDTTKTNKLSDTWRPNYDKLVLAHKNSDGSVSFDDIQLPQIPGYKTVANLVNPATALFAVSFMALPKPVAPAINNVKTAKTVTPVTPEATEAAELIKTEAKTAATPKAIDLSNDAVATTPKVIDLSNDAVTIAPKVIDLSNDAVTTPDVSTWQVADEPSHDTYHVSNGQYVVELPHISNAQLHVITNDSTKDSILFTYMGQNRKYVFNIKFVDGHYLLTTYKIKSGKLVKLIDYNFVKSSKMIEVILDWINLK